MALKRTPSIFEYWWHPLLAIPQSTTSPEYERLRRLWWDQTRVRGPSGKTIPEFFHPEWETHLTAVLWENFACLPVEDWAASLASTAGLKAMPAGIREAHWSYGWEATVDTKRGFRILDVVLHYRASTGEEGLLVVEAKRPGGRLSESKDLDARYYLDVPRLKAFGERRSLLYLVSEKVLPDAKRAVRRHDRDVGFLSWEALAGIQIQAASRMKDCPPRVRDFLAAAIHRHFLSYRITPSRQPLDYLASERSRRELIEDWKTNRQTVPQRQKELFWLPAVRSQ